MTHVCVPIMVESVEAALRAAQRAEHVGADLVEFRIDGFFGRDEHAGAEAIIRLVADSALPTIVTCRVETEGGRYTGDEHTRAGLYRALAEAPTPPAYLDVELASLERTQSLTDLARALRSRRDSGAVAPGVIVSMHDLHGRPADLTRQLARARALESASVLKVAFRARSLRDNLELFEILATRDRPTVALGMGEFGLMSRVLAPKFGAFLTFASLDATSGSAPGQPTISDLLGLYRFRSITLSTRVYGVIGWPVDRSLSPMVHNAAFESVGYDGVYLPLPVPPEWEHFKATLGVLVDDPRLDFAGASVTIPHKEHLVRFARERADDGWRLDELSSACGAGNTLTRVEDGWLVSNTDAPALVDCLRRAGLEPRGARVLILGAGGVARAAAAGLGAEGARITICNRSPDRAEALARELSPFVKRQGGGISAETIGAALLGESDVIINATPVGMSDGPEPDGAPLDLSVVVEAGSTPHVFDTVYKPRATPLLRTARSLGLRVTDGVDLFTRQAAEQSRLFTGVECAQVIERVSRDHEAQALCDQDRLDSTI